MNFLNRDQIPGSNILNMAFRVIAHECVKYYQALARPLNDVGQNVTEYAPPSLVRGSFQPVPKKLYETLGLDFQKSYFVLYASKEIIDTQRDVSADQIEFQNHRYQCESNTQWLGIDGWVGVLCVDIGQIPSLRHTFGFNAFNPTYPALLNTYDNFDCANFAPAGGE